MASASQTSIRLEAETSTVYDNADVRHLQTILNDIIEECESQGCLSVHEKRYLRTQLAAAVFKSVDAGEQDYARLKQSAIEALSAVPSSDPGS
jgi:hypothetical protein